MSLIPFQKQNNPYFGRQRVEQNMGEVENA